MAPKGDPSSLSDTEHFTKRQLPQTTVSRGHHPIHSLPTGVLRRVLEQLPPEDNKNTRLVSRTFNFETPRYRRTAEFMYQEDIDLFAKAFSTTYFLASSPPLNQSQKTSLQNLIKKAAAAQYWAQKAESELQERSSAEGRAKVWSTRHKLEELQVQMQVQVHAIVEGQRMVENFPHINKLVFIYDTPPIPPAKNSLQITPYEELVPDRDPTYRVLAECCLWPQGEAALDLAFLVYNNVRKLQLSYVFPRDVRGGNTGVGGEIGWTSVLPRTSKRTINSLFLCDVLFDGKHESDAAQLRIHESLELHLQGFWVPERKSDAWYSPKCIAHLIQALDPGKIPDANIRKQLRISIPPLSRWSGYKDRETYLDVSKSILMSLTQSLGTTLTAFCLNHFALDPFRTFAAETSSIWFPALREVALPLKHLLIFTKHLRITTSLGVLEKVAILLDGDEQGEAEELLFAIRHGARPSDADWQCLEGLSTLHFLGNGHLYTLYGSMWIGAFLAKWEVSDPHVKHTVLYRSWVGAHRQYPRLDDKGEWHRDDCHTQPLSSFVNEYVASYPQRAADRTSSDFVNYLEHNRASERHLRLHPRDWTTLQILDQHGAWRSIWNGTWPWPDQQISPLDKKVRRNVVNRTTIKEEIDSRDVATMFPNGALYKARHKGDTCYLERERYAV